MLEKVAIIQPSILIMKHSRKIVTALTLLVAMQATAQESANKDLDSCITQEKISKTVTGAAVGLLTGILAGQLGGKEDKTEKLALIGAVAGGALGYAKAYYTAVNTCMEKNPAWLPESNLTRSESYKKVVREFKYKPSKGDFLVVRNMDIASPVRPGEDIKALAKFVVLTPDGAESLVRIERKLFVIENGVEEEVPFPGNKFEERTVANDEHWEEFSIPVGPDIPKNTQLRIQYMVSLKGGAPISSSSVVTIN